MNKEMDYERGGYGFCEYTTDYGGGVEVYEIDNNGTPHLVGEVIDKSVDEIEDMTESEFGFFLAENGIL